MSGFFRKSALSVISLLLFVACGNNPFDIDVSGIKIEEVRIQRFDRDFFSIRPDNVSQKFSELQEKYGAFTELFVQNILCKTGLQDSACVQEILQFISDKDMREAYAACQQIFPDLSETEKELTDVFRRFRYYFPEKKIPVVIAMFSGFNYSFASADSVYAIGLEMYLGNKNKFYEWAQIPNYKRYVMRKEYLVSDFVRALMLNEFPNRTKSKTLLNEMIYEGKILYLKDALLPHAHDTLKIGFSEKQLIWCEKHEKDVWGYLVKNKLLYASSLEDIIQFTGEGPFTTGFVNESPARTGVWLGWKIVRRYMEENPQTTLQQLMNENDAQFILSKSKYKP